MQRDLKIATVQFFCLESSEQRSHDTRALRLSLTQSYRSCVMLLTLCIPSRINHLPLTLIVVATYLSLSLRLSLCAPPFFLGRDKPATQPANQAVNQPLMLQHVWLSPNPPWLTLAIIQSGLQLTGYIMINQSHPGSRRICSYGNRQLPNFLGFLSPKECEAFSKSSHFTQN